MSSKILAILSWAQCVNSKMFEHSSFMNHYLQAQKAQLVHRQSNRNKSLGSHNPHELLSFIKKWFYSHYSWHCNKKYVECIILPAAEWWAAGLCAGQLGCVEHHQYTQFFGSYEDPNNIGDISWKHFEYFRLVKCCKLLRTCYILKLEIVDQLYTYIYWRSVDILPMLNFSMETRSSMFTNTKNLWKHLLVWPKTNSLIDSGIGNVHMEFEIKVLKQTDVML